MQPDQAGQVAGIHASVLTDSVYTWIGRPFLEYYYRNLLTNPDFACYVYVVGSEVVGFLAITSAAGRVFQRQIRKDAIAIAGVLARTIGREPSKLGVILSATRFLFLERPAKLPEAQGEVLSFAVHPDYRTVVADGAGNLRPSDFYSQWRVPVATELFHAGMEHLSRRGVPDIRIMTPADNTASNRFYAKVGCRLAVRDVRIFGHATNIYYAAIEQVRSPNARQLPDQGDEAVR